MHIINVNNTILAKQWLTMPVKLYVNDANYIQPLNKDIEIIFDSNKNSLFKFGECERWILQDENKNDIGRIAVFTNKKYKQKIPTGGFGFFECINNQEAANFLLQKAKEWLEQRGMQAMDGPINFGERDKFWGCLVHGYHEALYNMNYNLPYYKDLLENFGCQVYYNQLCYGMKEENGIPERIVKWGTFFKNHADFRVEHIQKKNLDKYAEDFATVYNAAFAQHGEGKSLDVRVTKKMFASMKPVMDEKLCVFIYHLDKPVGAFLNIPDINQYFKGFNGKFGILEKLKFLYRKQFMPCKRFVGVVIGIDPKWQGKGIDAALHLEVGQYALRSDQYHEFEMQWIGDFNPKMINLAKNMEAKEVRRLSTYRYVFDRTIPFERMGKV
jgi:hypothetical protein